MAVMIAQWENEWILLSALPMARVQFLAMAEYLKGFYPADPPCCLVHNLGILKARYTTETVVEGGVGAPLVKNCFKWWTQQLIIRRNVNGPRWSRANWEKCLIFMPQLIGRPVSPWLPRRTEDAVLSYLTGWGWRKPIRTAVFLKALQVAEMSSKLG